MTGSIEDHKPDRYTVRKLRGAGGLGQPNDIPDRTGVDGDGITAPRQQIQAHRSEFDQKSWEARRSDSVNNSEKGENGMQECP